ncbi:4'-phosphopantetheinyl transferase family protein [Synechococcus sp. H65.1]|uniref:4'-phosphopantetheinyl transferase family protein n=1 Tax=unclassified Synechococcus TaxID=2626047 RepID=UPI0039C3FCEC
MVFQPRQPKAMLPYLQPPELSGPLELGRVRLRQRLLELEKPAIYLWLEEVPPLEALLPQLDLLSLEERQRAEQLHLLEDRRRFLAGRLLLRTLLSRYTGIPPQDISLDRTASGKPYWRDPPLPLQFNLSHSQQGILVGLTLQRRIGVDLEQIRPVPYWQRIAQRYFSAAEQAHLLACPPPERDAVFLQMWTQKEALLKAMGVGLAGARRLARDPDPAWLVLPLRVAEGYVAAVAMEQGKGSAAAAPPTLWLSQGLQGASQELVAVQPAARAGLPSFS